MYMYIVFPLTYWEIIANPRFMCCRVNNVGSHSVLSELMSVLDYCCARWLKQCIMKSFDVPLGFYEDILYCVCMPFVENST